MTCAYCDKESTLPWYRLNFPRYCPLCGAVNLKDSAIVASLAICADFVFFGGLLMVYVVLWMLFVRFPSILTAYFSARRDLAMNRLKRLGLYAAVVAVAMTINSLNNAYARRQADKTIAACEAFKAMHGQYPEKLEDLVPGFMPRVPRAKIFSAWSEFHYRAYDNRHSLMWVALPPFGRRYYSFEVKRWASLD
jgi:hypothetical protein